MNGQGQAPGSDDAGQPASEREPPSPTPNSEPNTNGRPTVPDYDLLRRIGHGAYGDVWLARSQATGALRAAKIVRRHTFEDGKPFHREFAGIQRFERISREHPSQLALFHIGRNDADGYFYYVMELADQTEPGPAAEEHTATHGNARLDVENYTPHTLRADLGNGRLPAAKVLEIGSALSEALSHLHSNGLVHRDVKPSNVIFVNGRPKLADIGLVTDASDQCSIVGTEGYLPPEGPGTPQADIFALGKVLYEAATGLDRREFPDLPPDIRTWPDAAQVFELNEIILKACAASAQARYGSTEAARGDLERLLGGKSIRHERQVERRWRRARRAAAWLTAITAALALVVLVGRVREAPMTVHVEKRSTNETANILYDMGKAHFDIFKGTNFAMAANYFQRAIQADANFAQAYGYLAATYFWEDDDWNPGWTFLPQAKTMALQALALDDTLAEPHLALGWYHAMREWNWSEAEKEDKRAVALNPSSSFCHLCRAELLRVMGRMDEALAQIYEAKRLDPHSRIINVRLVHYLIHARKFNEALAQLDQAIAMEATTGAEVNWIRRDIYLALGKIDEAFAEEAAGRTAIGQPQDEIARDVARAKPMTPAEKAKFMWRGRAGWDKQHGVLYDEACCLAQLGEADAALVCLQELLDRHDTELTFSVMTEWKLDPLRNDPRFHAILKTMRLE